MRRDFFGELEPLGQKLDHLGLVLRIEGPAPAFDIGLDVFHQRVRIGLRPGAQHESRRALISAERGGGGAHILKPFLHRTSRERRVHHRRDIVLVLKHRIEPQRGATGELDLVVALVDALLLEHLVKLESVGGVDRINHDSLAFDVGERPDLGLDDEVVIAVVAAEHDCDIGAGFVLERKGVVDRRMRDLIFSFRQTGAKLIRVHREFEIDGETTLGIEALRLRREQRHVLHTRENDNVQFCVLSTRIARRDCHCGYRDQCGGEQNLHLRVLPEVFVVVDGAPTAHYRASGNPEPWVPLSWGRADGVIVSL